MKKGDNTKEVSSEKPTVVDNKKESSKEKATAKKAEPVKKVYSAQVRKGFTFGTGKNSKTYKPGDTFSTQNENTLNYFKNVKKYLK